MTPKQKATLFSGLPLVLVHPMIQAFVLGRLRIEARANLDLPTDLVPTTIDNYENPKLPISEQSQDNPES